MSERRIGSYDKEKGGALYGDSSKYKSDRSRLDNVCDDLPSYKEAIQDGWNTQEQQPPCSHWSESGCRITVKSRKCCSCMDQRPEPKSGQYPMYVDGQGWVERATRWQYYCPNCQEYFDPDAKAKLLRDQRAWAEKRAKSIADERALADERDRKYFGFGRWIEAVKGCLPN
ncbi:hypothetical protein F4820DRAFT_376068 [Hypoxylon rubiginosum]|uniref:Uncharacterized protein n=1 Tax=Hypoxylon rubiginosum TaxID=110542 RepID=A0ACB9YXF6_9PEZI|nr:hypothetical protein F4820DRAFT_376068 [Hypoxylon rubiginosum]